MRSSCLITVCIGISIPFGHLPKKPLNLSRHLLVGLGAALGQARHLDAQGHPVGKSMAWGWSLALGAAAARDWAVLLNNC